MKRILTVALLCLAMALPAFAGQDDATPFAPKAKPGGGKWRIGYYEGGPYNQYVQTLRVTVANLVELGWVEPMEMPEFSDPEDAAAVWNWLSTKAKSKYVEFPPTAFWSADWEDTVREKTKAKVLAAMKSGQMDLMIAMGTWAGKDLAVKGHNVSTVVMSSSDPLGSGIITSIEDSGLDTLHARIDPERYLRQVRLFHELTEFTRLGIVYEDTEAGRSYAALDDVKAVAAERGFEIVPCITKLDVSADQAFNNLLACHAELASKADAVYLTENGGMQADKFDRLLAPINAAKLPTFSQAGSEEVMHGVLLSIAQAGFKYIGEFHAKIIGQILNGAQPRRLDMLFEEPPKIAINLKTAEIIGFDPPVDILMAADEIYEDIKIAR